MGNIVSLPSPTTGCDASTAFSIQFSGSGNASWDGQWMGIMDSPASQTGAVVQPVPKVKAATFFRDGNNHLYSADLATLNYTGTQSWSDQCLVFKPNTEKVNDWIWRSVQLNVDSTNTLKNVNPIDAAYPDFVIIRDSACVSAADWNPSYVEGVWGFNNAAAFTPITLNVVKTGVCPAPACKPLPAGSGPVPFPDKPANFLALQDFTDAATNARTPDGYQQAFANLKASSNANGYLGYTTLATYDVAGCAKKCNSIAGCQAFNIYFERDPKVDPASGDSCSNPPSTTNIKCSFWGGPVTTQNTVNAGQWRKNFQIVIAGSNGYVNNAIAPIPNYNSAAYYGNSIIVPPSIDCSNANPTLAWQLYNDGTPFSASRCAAACDAFSAQAKANAVGTEKPVLCNYFNTFILNKGNKAVGQMCYLYSQAFKSGRATGKTQVDAAGNVYSFASSYGFASSGNVGSCGTNY